MVKTVPTKPDNCSPDDRAERAEQIEEALTERNIRAVARMEAAAHSGRTPTDRLVDAITVFCGSMAFVYVHALWFGAWILWNGLPHIAKEWKWDPYPFQLLTLVVSLEAIFLSTFILISQNRQARLDERRNQLDLQINLLAEQESTKVLVLLEAIASHLKIPCLDDPELEQLVRQTQPEELVAEIENVMEKRDALNEEMQRLRNSS